jgi:lipoprotein NlpI
MAGLSMMQNKEIQKAKQLLTEGARGVERDTLNYEIFRFYLEGGSDYFVQEKIRKEKDDNLRRKFYYYLGEYYLYLDSPASAAACFDESAKAQLGFEARTSQWHLK